MRNLVGVDIHELAGARVSAQVPIPTGVINRLVAARLDGRGAVAAAVVAPRQDNVIEVDVTPSARLIPRVRVQAMVERQPQFPADPRLILRWRIPAAGPLARMAGPFLANLKSLPPGVRIDADFIVIDLREVLAAHGEADLLPYVRSLRVETRAEGLVVRFDLGVGQEAVQ